MLKTALMSLVPISPRRPLKALVELILIYCAGGTCGTVPAKESWSMEIGEEGAVGHDAGTDYGCRWLDLDPKKPNLNEV